MPASSDKPYEYDCLISYNTDTSAAEARLLYIVLRAWGLKTWLYEVSMLFGHISQTTTDAARNSERLVIVCSDEWFKSTPCKQEHEAFCERDSDSKVLPVVFYSEDIPSQFEDTVVYRLTRDDEDKEDDEWEKFAGACGVNAGVSSVIKLVRKELQEVLAWNKLAELLKAREPVTSLQEAPPTLQAAIRLLNQRRLRGPLRELVRAVLSSEYSLAITLAETYEKRYEDHASFWFYWGVALHELHKRDEAREKMLKAQKALEASGDDMQLPKKWRELYPPDKQGST